MINIEPGDIITLKKNHACGGNKFEVIRSGADVKLKCLTCSHILMLPRDKFNKAVKK